MVKKREQHLSYRLIFLQIPRECANLFNIPPHGGALLTIARQLDYHLLSNSEACTPIYCMEGRVTERNKGALQSSDEGLELVVRLCRGIVTKASCGSQERDASSSSSSDRTIRAFIHGVRVTLDCDDNQHSLTGEERFTDVMVIIINKENSKWLGLSIDFG
ncbi:hypothetical protein TNCV_4084771 [Trichonephila clavipes]|nr:hypothetical protein TNCV_4084771 [Trichonephila clavipes]